MPFALKQPVLSSADLIRQAKEAVDSEASPPLDHSVTACPLLLPTAANATAEPTDSSRSDAPSGELPSTKHLEKESSIPEREAGVSNSPALSHAVRVLGNTAERTIACFVVAASFLLSRTFLLVLVASALVSAGQALVDHTFFMFTNWLDQLFRYPNVS